MTCKSVEPQSSNSETCGVSEKVPSNMEQMMQKMLASCGPMMAERTRGASPCEGEHVPGDETGQQPQDVTQSVAGCGCAPMMERMLGKHYGVGIKKGSEPE
jgi:hypothetical protein